MDDKISDRKHREMFSAEVWIPGPVFYSRELSERAKLLYGLLAAMHTAPKYYCWAHNETLAAYLQCSERSMHRALDELVQAGEVEILDAQGGRKNERKIKCVRVQPFNLATGDKVNLATGGKVPNNSKNNNKKGKGQGAEPLPDGADISPKDWLHRWVADMELPMETATALIGDLDALLDNRALLKCPIKSVFAAKLLTAELRKVSDGEDYPIPAMRYCLQKAILKGWKTVFPIDDDRRADYRRWLIAQGITKAEPLPSSDDYF